MRTRGVDPISQEQAEWRMLTAMLGRGLTQAYLVRPGAAQPKLTLHAQDRAAVETAGARIGLAKAMLVVDANGAYRGAQLYRVDNSLEQFLEIQLPAGARLWTAHVAGEPVKPAAGKWPRRNRRRRRADSADQDGPRRRRLSGDAEIRRPTRPAGRDRPRAISADPHREHSRRAEPGRACTCRRTYDWFNFGGTMRLVQSEGDLAAGWLAYNTRQIDLAIQAWQSEDAFARTAGHGIISNPCKPNPTR